VPSLLFFSYAPPTCHGGRRRFAAARGAFSHFLLQYFIREILLLSRSLPEVGDRGFFAISLSFLLPPQVGASFLLECSVRLPLVKISPCLCQVCAVRLLFSAIEEEGLEMVAAAFLYAPATGAAFISSDRDSFREMMPSFAFSRLPAR